jgi:cytochrome P450
MDGTFKHSAEELDLGLDRTVIQEVLESNLPASEKDFDRIWREAQTVISAGTETTANTLAVTHFYLLNNPESRQKLTEELARALPEKYAPVSLSVVEKLPYLVRAWPTTILSILS